MLDKILKWSFPITLLISVSTAFYPNGIFSIISPYGMTILAICAYSLGWILSSFVFDQKSGDYHVSRHIALAAIFALPLVAIVFTPSYLYPYIVGKGFIFRFLAIIAGLSALHLTLTHEEYKVRLTPFFTGSLFFVVAMALATIFSMDPSRSFFSNYERMEGFINVLLVFAVVFSIAVIRIKEIEWFRIFKIHVVISGIIAFIGVLQYFVGFLQLTGLSGFPILNLCLNQGPACRIDATLGNSIYIGLYCAMSFWLMLYAILVNKVKNNFLYIITFLNLAAVYFSGTRGVWVGMFLGLVVLFITKFWFDGKKKEAALCVLASIAFVGLFAGFVFYANSNNLYQDVALVKRFSSIHTLFARATIWGMALESWTQKPIFGWGQENFIHAFNLNYSPAMYGQETYFDHPHNTYLGWLVAGGLVGFLAFLYLIFSAVIGVIKSQALKEKENDLIIPIIFALLVTYLVHIFFVFDNLTSTLLFIAISSYFGSGVSYGVVNMKIRSKAFEQYFTFGLIALGIVFVYFVVQKPSYANALTIEAMTYTNRNSGDPATMVEGVKGAYNKAINQNSFGNYEIREFYLQKSLEYINLIPQVQDEKVKNAILGLANDALSQFNYQVETNPFDHRARFMLGLYYLNIKNYDMAINTLKQAVELAPNKQIALVYLAKAYLLKGDSTNASIYYEKAISITPKNIAGYNQLQMEYVQTLLLTNQDVKAVSIIRNMLPTVSREDFNTLIGQMTQIFSNRKDLKTLINTLDEAIKIDPRNPNFVLWMAQALVASGDYNGAVNVINRMTTTNPELVNQFIGELQKYVAEQEKKTVESATTTKKK